jgi:hypothetical protein
MGLATTPHREQFRFLLRHSSWRAFFMSAVEPNPLRRSAWAGVEWPVWDRYLYVLATRLLWRYAARHGDVLTLELGEPTLGSPFPVRAQGQLISQDLANCALEMTTIRDALATRPPPQHIVEIGAGYGRPAFVLLSLYPDAHYTVVDIEPALSISQWSLVKLFPDRQLQFLTPDKRYRMGGPADLVISISSLQEMVLDQVADYLHWIDRIAEGGIVYLKQWDRWHNPIDQTRCGSTTTPSPAAGCRSPTPPAGCRQRFANGCGR